MSQNSKIEWTDHTFNPWIGCQKVGPGCDNCYAEAMMADRLHKVQWGPGAERVRTSIANWRNPVAWNANHELFFAQNGRRQRVFCASLADVFDNEVPRAWRQDLFDLILATPNLDWLLLTKRVGNAARMLQDVAEQRGALMDARDHYRPLPNVWIGATVVNQAEANRDVPKLLGIPAHVRFLSMEPLLGPVNLRLLCTPNDRVMVNALTGQSGTGFETVGDFDRGIDWVIVGGESGPDARPMHPDWARSLRDQCSAAGVPFLFKQWGEWVPAEIANSQGSTIDTARWWSFGRENIESAAALVDVQPDVYRLGKKAAGRLLDGVQHDGFPRGAA